MSAAKRYTPEFKAQAVDLYRRSNSNFSAVARELGIDSGSLAAWVKVSEGKPEKTKDNPFQMKEDLRRLQRENKRLKEENEILLKASAFFASKQM